MKIILASLVSLLTLTVALADEPIGQYQLVPGIVHTVGTTSAFDQHTMFRLDTKTGRTWVYESGTVKGNHVEFWLEITEPENGNANRTEH